MKLVAAPNAFKGSLSAFDAARAIAIGARRALPSAHVTELPIADGGDGTAEVLCRALGGRFCEVPCVDALGRPLTGRYCWLPDATAVLDVATASGLARLASDELDPLLATSFGTGLVLRAALAAGAERVILGVGGSASVDAGAGILQALGARLLDEQGRELPQGGAALGRLARIDLSELDARARQVPLEIACDVDSPLLGTEGAARSFGPQKGATPAMVEQLETALAHTAHVVRRDFGRDVTRLDFGGAAGGMAAGLHGVLGAKLRPGAELLLDRLRFEQQLDGARLCITGEGRLDRQSLRNKGPLGVARRAKARGVPVVALVGEIAEDLRPNELAELSQRVALRGPGMSLEQAMRDTSTLLEAAAERIVRERLAR